MNILLPTNLPEFAFMTDSSILIGRNVIIHIPSLSIFEIFERDRIRLNDDVVSEEFDFVSLAGNYEEMVCAVHYSRLPDFQLESVIKKAIKFYCDDCNTIDRQNMASEN